MRDYIISQIKRLATETGAPPGQIAFANVTGITQSKWRGVYWARWGDALAEAGYAPNEWNQRKDSREILEQVAALCRGFGRLPTRAEIMLHRQSNPDFPAQKTVARHFRTNADLTSALRELAAEGGQWSDLTDLLPNASAVEQRPVRSQQPEGLVYLLKSGKHYKIGRSDDIERRFREVTIALPESVTLIHTIRTDDPSGIEAYWHRRFADRRANGEWFALTGDDVRAFRKRTFQ